MPDAYSCFFDFTEKSDSDEERRPGEEPPGGGGGAGKAGRPPASPQARPPPAWGQAPLLDQEGKGIDVDEHPRALEEMARQFESRGWVHIPRLGVPPQCRSKVQLEVDQLQNPKRAQRKAGGVLSQGMTNMADSNAEGQRARTDGVLFMDFHAGAASACLRQQLRGFFKLDQIIERVACQLATQLQGSELGMHLRGRTRMMYARYEPGGFYLPHVDADEGDDRVLTAVYYLNQDWRPEDGGELRLHPSDGQPRVSILPEEDTLVLFRADELVHEVCLARARRFAVTIWFKGVCGQVRADVNGSLQRAVPLRKLPESLRASLPLGWAAAAPPQVAADQWLPADQPPCAEQGGVCPTPAQAVESSDSGSDGGAAPDPGPVLVCWNIVGFRLRQGAEKLAGLFVAARRLGIRDHVVLSYPEDYGIEGEGHRWRDYVDRLVEAIDRKPRRVGRPLLLWAHSTATAPALSLAWRLGPRVLKVYVVDGCAPARGGPDLWAETCAFFRSWSDERWVLQLSAWNSGSSVLREMAAAVLGGGWDVSRSRGAQDFLAHGKRQYINAVHPDLAADVGVIAAPIFALSMLRDEVIPYEHVRNLADWTSAGLRLETFDATHMGWLEPTADRAGGALRCGVFDRICEDLRANLGCWRPRAPGG